jgi:hypothetical protein
MAVPLLSACQSDELIKSHRTAGLNGGFETTEDGYPVNWAFFPNPTADSTFQVAVDSEKVLEGNFSLRVTTKPGEKIPGFRSRRVEVQPGRNYRLSLSFQNQGCSLQVRRTLQDELGITNLRQDTIVDTSAPSTEWVTFEETLSISDQEAKVFLVFLISGSGTLWFDDVRVEEIAGRS